MQRRKVQVWADGGGRLGTAWQPSGVAVAAYPLNPWGACRPVVRQRRPGPVLQERKMGAAAAAPIAVLGACGRQRRANIASEA